MRGPSLLYESWRGRDLPVDWLPLTLLQQTDNVMASLPQSGSTKHYQLKSAQSNRIRPRELYHALRDCQLFLRDGRAIFSI